MSVKTSAIVVALASLFTVSTSFAATATSATTSPEKPAVKTVEHKAPVKHYKKEVRKHHWKRVEHKAVEKKEVKKGEVIAKKAEGGAVKGEVAKVGEKAAVATQAEAK